VNRVLAAVVGALVSTALAGCGIPTDDAPRGIVPPRGPFQGLAPAESTTSGRGTVAEQLYLVKDDKIVSVVRWLPAAPTIDTQLADLLAGPTDPEQDAGLTSALTGTNIIADVSLDDGAATVDVGDLADTNRNDQVLAFAQIVCTLTTRSDVTNVSFLKAGQRLSVPRADGSLSQGPLTAADYASLITPA
jgi:spore germination protein GerM